MAEVPAVAAPVSKMYLSQAAFLSVAYVEDGKKSTIHFQNGVFVTADKDEQAHIEGLAQFGRSVTLAPSAKEAAVAKAVALRGVANKAIAEAEAAEAAAKALK